MIPNVNVWPTNGCYVQHHTGSPLLSLRHLCVLRISAGDALAIGLLYASRVSLAVGLEPPGELPCWPCSHLPFIHSFIHSEDLYSASSRDSYSEALPAQPRTKKKDLREM